jgi:hypothetical protein
LRVAHRQRCTSAVAAIKLSLIGIETPLARSAREQLGPAQAGLRFPRQALDARYILPENH